MTPSHRDSDRSRQNPASARYSEDDAHILIDLMKGEVAAVDCYGHAREAVNDEPLRFSLADMLARHQQLAEALTDRLDARGLSVPETPSFWGTSLVYLERLGAALGDGACLAVLQAGEIQGLKRWRKMIDELADQEAAAWVADHCIPVGEQNRGELDAMLYSLWHGADPREG